MKIISSRIKHIFSCLRKLSNSDVGVARGNVIQEIRPKADFKTGYFVKKKAGGATVERLNKDRFIYYSEYVFMIFFTWCGPSDVNITPSSVFSFHIYTGGGIA